MRPRPQKGTSPLPWAFSSSPDYSSTLLTASLIHRQSRKSTPPNNNLLINLINTVRERLRGRQLFYILTSPLTFTDRDGAPYKSADS